MQITSWEVTKSRKPQHATLVVLGIVLAGGFLPLIDYLGSGAWESLVLSLVLVVLGGGTIVYFGFLAPRVLSYQFSEQSLSIHGPIGTREVAWGDITQVDSLASPQLVRIFGVALPGLQYGLFHAEGLGRVTIYGTSFDSKIVLLKLRSGEQLILTPKLYEEFVTGIQQHMQVT